MTSDQVGQGQSRRIPFDISAAHSARVYNYWLGGKDNFAADREVAQQALQTFPGIVRAARANRAFLVRAVRYLVAEAGIRQFLDVGTGIPAADNTHEVAQAIEPECRVVYVDYDPVVLLHAKALLDSCPEGATDYVEADLRDPDKILRWAARTLDLSRPVALTILSTLHLVPDDGDPVAAVRRLTAALAPGSYLAISHGASDLENGVVADMAASVQGLAQVETVTPRSREQVARFFDGLELAEPGLVRISQWRPDSEMQAAARVPMWAGVAVKR